MLTTFEVVFKQAIFDLVADSFASLAAFSAANLFAKAAAAISSLVYKFRYFVFVNLLGLRFTISSNLVLAI